MDRGSVWYIYVLVLRYGEEGVGLCWWKTRFGLVERFDEIKCRDGDESEQLVRR